MRYCYLYRTFETLEFARIICLGFVYTTASRRLITSKVFVRTKCVAIVPSVSRNSMWRTYFWGGGAGHDVFWGSWSFGGILRRWRYFILRGWTVSDLGVNLQNIFTKPPKNMQETSKKYKCRFESSGERHPEWEHALIGRLERVLADVARYKDRQSQRVERALGLSSGGAAGTGEEMDAVTAGRVAESEKEAAEALAAAEELEKEAVECGEAVNRKLEEAEAAGEEGEVEKSMELTEEAEGIRRKKRELEERADLKRKRAAEARTAATQARAMALRGPSALAAVLAMGKGNEQNLRVCQDCGKMLSVRDSDSRLAEHFKGRMHRGVVECRKRLDDARAALQQQQTPAAPYRQHYDPDRY